MIRRRSPHPTSGQGGWITGLLAVALGVFFALGGEIRHGVDLDGVDPTNRVAFGLTVAAVGVLLVVWWAIDADRATRRRSRRRRRRRR
jgi:hypothetical protein